MGAAADKAAGSRIAPDPDNPPTEKHLPAPANGGTAANRERTDQGSPRTPCQPCAATAAGKSRYCGGRSVLCALQSSQGIGPQAIGRMAFDLQLQRGKKKKSGRRMRLGPGQIRLQPGGSCCFLLFLGPPRAVKGRASGAIWDSEPCSKLWAAPIGPSRPRWGSHRNRNSASPEKSGTRQPPYGPRFQGSGGFRARHPTGPPALQTAVIRLPC